MSKGLLGALEGLNDESIVSSTEEVDFSTSMLNAMELCRDLDDINGELHEACDEFDNAESAVERLGAIAAAIENYGICRPMMEAVDPAGELSGAAICCSYETLGEAPVYDAMAEFCIESIEEVIDCSVESWDDATDVMEWTLEASEEAAWDTVKKKAADIGKKVGVGLTEEEKEKAEKDAKKKAHADAKENEADSETQKFRAEESRRKKQAGAHEREEMRRKALAQIHAKVGIPVEKGTAKAAHLINQGSEKFNKLGDAAKVGVVAVVGAAVIYAAVKFMMFIGGHLIKLGKSIAAACTSFENALKSAEQRLSEIHSFDDAKFKSESFRAYKKDEFHKAIAGGNTLIKMMDGGAFIKLSQGLASQMSGSGITMAHVESFASKAKSLMAQANNAKMDASPSKGTGSSLGWNVGDVGAAVREAASHVNAAKVCCQHIEAAGKESAVIAKALQSHAKAHKELDESQRAALKAASKELREVSNYSGTVANMISSNVRGVAESALGMARAAMKCGK